MIHLMISRADSSRNSAIVALVTFRIRTILVQPEALIWHGLQPRSHTCQFWKMIIGGSRLFSNEWFERWNPIQIFQWHGQTCGYGGSIRMEDGNQKRPFGR